MTTLTPDLDRRARYGNAAVAQRALSERRRRHTPSSPAGTRAGEQLAREGGEVTLDDVIVGAWEGLLGHHTVSCPVCSGALAPRYGAGSAPVGGRCKDCASTLG